MNVTYFCKTCDKVSRVPFDTSAVAVHCSRCSSKQEFPSSFLGEDSEGNCTLERCTICGSHELYYRKQFNQRLGIGIIAVGSTLSTIAYAYHNLFWTFSILFAFAGVDLLFYIFMKNLLQCYKCNSEFRGFDESPEYKPFDLEVHEKYHQQRVRLERAEKEQQWLEQRAQQQTAKQADEEPADNTGR